MMRAYELLFWVLDGRTPSRLALRPYERLHALRLCLLAALACCACVYTPANNDEVRDITEPVSFSGVVLSPRSEVTVTAANSPAGTFCPWPGSTTRSRTTRTTWDGRSYFAWNLSSAVPEAHWSPGVDDEGCPTLETHVRATTGSWALQTFDTAMGDSLECLEQHGGDLEGLAACRSAHSPILRLHRPVTHVGDVLVNTVAQLADLRCVQAIEGSLQIDIPSQQTDLVSLPRLETVTGNLTLMYNMYGASGPNGPLVDTRCGMTQAVSGVVTRFDLPNLRSVHGDVTLQQMGGGSRPPNVSVEGIELGLEALDEVRGHINISVRQPGGSPCGLDRLAYTGGDVVIRILSFNEVGIQSELLLPRLEAVGGSFELYMGHNWVGSPFAALTRVNQLIIESQRQPHSPRLPALTTVVGKATLTGYFFYFPTGFETLGSLSVSESTFQDLQTIGGPSITIEGLEISDNQALSSLLDANGSSKFNLSSSAPLRIAGNRVLPVAEVCAFVNYQRSGGWVGLADLGAVTCP